MVRSATAGSIEGRSGRRDTGKYKALFEKMQQLEKKDNQVKDAPPKAPASPKQTRNTRGSANTKAREKKEIKRTVNKKVKETKAPAKRSKTAPQKKPTGISASTDKKIPSVKAFVKIHAKI